MYSGLEQGMLTNMNSKQGQYQIYHSLGCTLIKNVPFCNNHLTKLSLMLATRCSLAGWSKELAHEDQASAFLKTNLKKFLWMALHSKQKPCQIVKKALTWLPQVNSTL